MLLYQTPHLSDERKAEKNLELFFCLSSLDMHCNIFSLTTEVKWSINPFLSSAMPETCSSLSFKQGENICDSLSAN